MDDRVIIEAANSGASGFKNRAPYEQGAQQRDQPKNSPEKKIPTVNKGVLNANIENFQVLPQSL